MPYVEIDLGLIDEHDLIEELEDRGYEVRDERVSDGRRQTPYQYAVLMHEALSLNQADKLDDLMRRFIYDYSDRTVTVL